MKPEEILRIKDQELQDKAKKTPWKEEKQDVRYLETLLKLEHPDGKIGPMIKSIDKMPESLDDEIKMELNPTFIKIQQYFESKYDEHFGKLLFFKYINKYLTPQRDD